MSLDIDNPFAIKVANNPELHAVDDAKTKLLDLKTSFSAKEPMLKVATSIPIRFQARIAMQISLPISL